MIGIKFLVDEYTHLYNIIAYGFNNYNDKKIKKNIDNCGLTFDELQKLKQKLSNYNITPNSTKKVIGITFPNDVCGKISNIIECWIKNYHTKFVKKNITSCGITLDDLQKLLQKLSQHYVKPFPIKIVKKSEKKVRKTINIKIFDDEYTKIHNLLEYGLNNYMGDDTVKKIIDECGLTFDDLKKLKRKLKCNYTKQTSIKKEEQVVPIVPIVDVIETEAIVDVEKESIIVDIIETETIVDVKEESLIDVIFDTKNNCLVEKINNIDEKKQIQNNNQHERKFEEKTGLNFNDFYKSHKPKLAWHLTKWTKNLSIAEDYADDAFIQALNKIDTYNKGKGAQVHTWIYTIADNIVKKEYRDSQRLPSISMDKEIAEHTKMSDFLFVDDGYKEIDRQQVISKKAEIVKSTIESFPEKQEKYKTVLILRELQSMSYNDISIKLNLNLSTVKSQIKKGREILIKKIEKKFKYIDEYGIK